ncbi:MAG: hypothetical protein JXB62_02075 [Pirellulales bacterium]|nr:hypothetical protein [Pirellulales bacterium]
MARKKNDPLPDPANDRSETADNPGAGQSPEVVQAADAVRRAEAELNRARQLYRQVRQEATGRLKAVREKNLGELIDGTLSAVKKHPGPGVLVAAAIGFFLGRLFRR